MNIAQDIAILKSQIRKVFSKNIFSPIARKTGCTLRRTALCCGWQVRGDTLGPSPPWHSPLSSPQQGREILIFKLWVRIWRSNLGWPRGNPQFWEGSENFHVFEIFKHQMRKWKDGYITFLNFLKVKNIFR